MRTPPSAKSNHNNNNNKKRAARNEVEVEAKGKGTSKVKAKVKVKLMLKLKESQARRSPSPSVRAHAYDDATMRLKQNILLLTTTERPTERTGRPNRSSKRTTPCDLDVDLEPRLDLYWTKHKAETTKKRACKKKFPRSEAAFVVVVVVVRPHIRRNLGNVLTAPS